MYSTSQVSFGMDVLVALLVLPTASALTIPGIIEP
jgi:hypothetical protein